MVLVAVASVPSAWPLQPEPFLPPQKNFPGEVRGYLEPSGAKHRHRTGQPSRARHTGQDSPPGTGSPPGLARKLRLLLGLTRSQGPSGSLSNRLHFRDKGAGGWKWPPWPLQEEPAPDESPWTRPTGYIKTVPEGKTRLKNHDSGDMARHSWL